jgi:hypothetical protein
MPSKIRHIEQAKSNARFLSLFDLARTQHPDWAITVAFYTAVHLVEALFAVQCLHHENHAPRNTQVSLSLPEVAGNYVAMYVASRRARYQCADIRTHEAQLLIASSPAIMKPCAGRCARISASVYSLVGAWPKVPHVGGGPTTPASADQSQLLRHP